MKSKIILFFVFINCIGYSQRYSGNSFGSRSGILGIQDNPATFLNKNQKWDINILGFGAHIYSEYGYIADQSVLSLSGAKNIYNASDSIPLNTYDPENDALFYANQYSEPISGILFNQIFNLPSAAYKFNDFSAGVFTNVRSHMDGLNTPVFLNYLNLKALIDFKNYTITPTRINAMAWGEIGVHLGYRHELENGCTLALGLNPKYLLGLEAIYLQNKTNYDFVRDRDTFIADEANVTVGFASGSSRVSNDYKFGIHGKGLGLDIGLEYMIPNEDEESESPHYMKFGASVKDIGSITFNKNAEEHNFVSNNLFEVYKYVTDNRNKNYDVIQRLSYWVYGDSSKSLVKKQITMALPTCVNFHWDYNIRPDFFVNAFISRRISSLNQQLSAPNVIMLSGRYEKKWFEGGASMSLTEDEWFGVGAYVRLGIFTIGSDHINTILFSQPKLRGSDIYMSLKLFPFKSPDGSDESYEKMGGKSGKRSKCPTYR